MWVRVVTGSDIVGARARKNPQIALRAFLCSFHRSDVKQKLSRLRVNGVVTLSGLRISL